MKKILLLAGLVAIAASCTRELSEGISNNGTQLYPLTFSAGTETTKTILDGSAFLWEQSDEIGIYDDVAINKFTTKNLTTPSQVASFEGSAAAAPSYIGIAPYSAAALAKGVISVTIPSVQNVSEGHTFDTKALLSVCKTESTSLEFINKFSLAKFSITQENIMSVTIIGNSGEAISGTAALNKDDLTLGAANQTSVTVTYGDEETFPLGDYYAIIYPTTFASGFRVVLTNDEGSKGVKKLTSSKTFERNGGLDLKTVDNISTWVPNTISTFDQLTMFARMADTYSKGETIKLGADINCESNEWVPFNLFCNFDGQNHRIYNYVVTDPCRYAGFFALLAKGCSVNLKDVCFGSSDYDFSTKKGTYDGVSKIVFKNSSSAGSWAYCGGVCAYAYAGTTFENVVNFTSVSVNANTTSYQLRVGGVSGTIKDDVTMKDCINFGTVTYNSNKATKAGSQVCSLGGVTSTLDGTGSHLIGCVNNGAVTNENPIVCDMGGVVGLMQEKNCSVENCSNTGAVINNAKSVSLSTGYVVRVGGVVGTAIKGGILIEKCSNSGAVKQTATPDTLHLALGGVVGILNGAVTVKGCTNTSNDITPTAEMVKVPSIGGIVGYINGSGGLVTKSEDGTLTVNSGNYTQGSNFANVSYAGGIVGYVNSETAVVEFCKNTGNINQSTIQTTGGNNQYVGGIVATTKHVVRDCENTGGLLGTGGNNNVYPVVGGIVGYLSNYAGAGVYRCKNSGQLQMSKGSAGNIIAGGIAGIFCATKGTMEDCENAGTVYIGRNSTVHAGALVGRMEVNTSKAEITNLCGCKVNCTCNYSGPSYVAGYCGMVIGALSSTAKANLILGSEAKPIIVGGTIMGRAYSDKDKGISIEAFTAEINDANLATYFYGNKNNATTSKVSYNAQVAQ